VDAHDRDQDLGQRRGARRGQVTILPVRAELGLEVLKSAPALEPVEPPVHLSGAGAVDRVSCQAIRFPRATPPASSRRASPDITTPVRPPSMMLSGTTLPRTWLRVWCWISSAPTRSRIALATSSPAKKNRTRLRSARKSCFKDSSLNSSFQVQTPAKPQKDQTSSCNSPRRSISAR